MRVSGKLFLEISEYRKIRNDSNDSNESLGSSDIAGTISIYRVPLKRFGLRSVCLPRMERLRSLAIVSSKGIESPVVNHH